MEKTEDPEKERMLMWRHRFPMSNLHGMSCPDECFDPSHYPDGYPSDDNDGEVERSE